MTRIVTIIESILGAGTYRRTASFPTPRLTKGPIWAERPIIGGDPSARPARRGA